MLCFRMKRVTLISLRTLGHQKWLVPVSFFRFRHLMWAIITLKSNQIKNFINVSEIFSLQAANWGHKVTSNR